MRPPGNACSAGWQEELRGALHQLYDEPQANVDDRGNLKEKREKEDWDQNNKPGHGEEEKEAGKYAADGTRSTDRWHHRERIKSAMRIGGDEATSKEEEKVPKGSEPVLDRWSE